MKLFNKLTRRALIISNIALILLLGALGIFSLYKRAFWHEKFDSLAVDRSYDIVSRDRDIDDLLRFIILPDTSEYDTLDDFGKTTLLREWCHNNISPKVLPGDSSVSYYDYSKASLFYRVLSENAGYLCGGNTYILATVYDLFGYETTSLNMGFPATRDTHVVALVKIWVNGEKRIIVQDAYFNRTVLDSNGFPADFKTILDAVRRSDFSGLSLSETVIQKVVFNTWHDKMVDLFSKHGLSANFLNLFYFPLGIGKAWGGEGCTQKYQIFTTHLTALENRTDGMRVKLDE